MIKLLIVIILLIILICNLLNLKKYKESKIKNENFEGMSALEGLLRMVTNPELERNKLINYTSTL